MTGTGVRLADQGHFWVGTTYERHNDQTVVDGTQLYVEYQIPEHQTQPLPVVMIHGGGGQGLDWTATPDGRPGWRTLLIQQGYAVYVIDRPGHGRSPRTIAESGSPAVPGLPSSVEVLGAMFAGADDPLHTQWPGTGGIDDPALTQVLASQRQTGFDPARDHALMRARGSELLDQIGPAILIASSAGGPSAWQIADARPELVRGIVALEPVGPSGPMPLPWGLSAAPLTYDPPIDAGGALDLVDTERPDGTPMRLQPDRPRTLPNLTEVPIAVVSAERSFAGPMDIGTVAFLRQAGCRSVEHIMLVDRGIHGNGHLMMIELNNDEVLDVVTQWITAAVRPRTTQDA